MTIKIVPEILDHTSLEVNGAKNISIFHTLSGKGDLAENSHFLTSKTEFLATDIIHFKSKFLYQTMIDKTGGWRREVWR